MNTKKFICLGFALFMAVTGVFAQKDILTIEDALMISKMKNMEEASSFLWKYGYSRSNCDERLHRINDTVSYWFKDCEIDCFPGVSPNIYKVNKKSASAVSVLATRNARALEFVVCNKNAKEDCLKQMKNLGFKRVKKGEKGEEYYAKANDTIKVSTQEGMAFTYVEVLYGRERPLRASKEMFEWMEESIINEGFKCIKKDKIGYEYAKETDTLRFLFDRSWDGTMFEFQFHLTNWEFLDGFWVDISEYYEKEETIEDKPVMDPDVDPEFPGGIEALLKYLGENIKYPELARTNGISGKVYVTFVIEKDGSISNPKILRDIGGGCGQEALRVVRGMPKWKPGKVDGRPVRVQFNLPVNFQFNEAPKE